MVQTEIYGNNSLFHTTIPPLYDKGAWRKLVTILEKGHEEVRVSQAESAKYTLFL
jgi:hypothetical protein